MEMSFSVVKTIFFFFFFKLFSSYLLQNIPDAELDKLSNRIFKFDAAKDSWTECARMKYSRYRCSTAVLNGEIYILGTTIKLWCCV